MKNEFTSGLITKHSELLEDVSLIRTLGGLLTTKSRIVIISPILAQLCLLDQRFKDELSNQIDILAILAD
jgi:hypothetical protein